MGEYTILIEGHGPNQNGGDPRDADAHAKAVGEHLRALGHEDVKVTFVYGRKLALSVADDAEADGCTVLRFE